MPIHAQWSDGDCPLPLVARVLSSGGAFMIACASWFMSVSAALIFVLPRARCVIRLDGIRSVRVPTLTTRLRR